MRRRRAWARAKGKRPFQPDGVPASSTDTRTWWDWGTVAASTVGDGFGVMLGDGLGCYDLDRVGNAEVLKALAIIPEPVVFIEWSQSGEGVHIFVEADEGPGGYVDLDGLQVERYTRQRFIRVTGRRWVHPSTP